MRAPTAGAPALTSRAFRVVEMFEEAVAEYAGAKYGVATDSCTTAIFLSLLRNHVGGGLLVSTPARTYISVPNAIKRAGGRVQFTDEEWSGAYVLGVTTVTDSALRMRRGMFTGGFYCVSFHLRKHIKIGRGGMILTDHAGSANWFRKMRFDGRDGSVPFMQDTGITEHGFNAYMLPEQAARGLQLLEALPDDPPDLDLAYPDLRALPGIKW